ncbi:MAG: phage tail protein [Rhodospirillales bacterium]|nr:MAG: phage tail protein [Rhodospirillales bacterium]
MPTGEVPMPASPTRSVQERYRRAREGRACWERVWQDCYDFALPLRANVAGAEPRAETRGDRLFDATAPDAIEQLAASLFSQLMPPQTAWFALVPGCDVDPDARRDLAAHLDRASRVMLTHFDRSNFALEVHQCLLDVVTAGTASLAFEEAAPGSASAFHFAAVPLSQVVIEDSGSGRADTTFRVSALSSRQVGERFPGAASRQTLEGCADAMTDGRIPVVEAVIPEGAAYRYVAFIEAAARAAEPLTLAEGVFQTAPFINFRWLKAPGETYGRSPVMKALPDIKTANKVVELVLKNASIAATGIWQADDDGVLNPATVKLVPGSIIPKAVGSSGLTPLSAPGRFDVSELVLEQLRARIRRALLVDQLGELHGPRMTATEVLERAAEVARIFGATFARLQTELLRPLLARAYAILVRRGEIADLPLDGRLVDVRCRALQTRFQAQQEAQNTMLWLTFTRELGPEAMAVVDQAAATRWLGQILGVPDVLMRGERLPATGVALGTGAGSDAAAPRSGDDGTVSMTDGRLTWTPEPADVAVYLGDSIDAGA